MKFGTYIRKQRAFKQKTDRSYSLRSVARQLEVEPSYLSKIERNEVPPFSVGKIVQLASILNEDADELLARAGKIAPDLQEIIRKKPKLFSSILRQIKNLPDEAVISIIREVKDGEW